MNDPYANVSDVSDVSGITKENPDGLKIQGASNDVTPENQNFRSSFFKRTRSPIWTRTLALLIDIPFISALGALIAYTTTIASVDTLFGPAIVAGAAGFFYHFATEASPLQGTIGKKVMGLKNIRINGEKISVITALLRSFARISAWVTLGSVNVIFAMIGQRATYHDRLTRTRLVKVKLMLAGDQQNLKFAPDMQWGVVKKTLAVVGWFLSILVTFWFAVMVQSSAQTRAMVTQAYLAVSPALQGIKSKYESGQGFPASLEEVAKPLTPQELEDANLEEVGYVASKGIVLLKLAPKTGLDIVMYVAPITNVPGSNGKIVWVCNSLQPVMSNHLPSQCPSKEQLALRFLIDKANGSNKK